MPAWAWIALLAIGTVVVIIAIAWLVIVRKDEDEDPYDTGWDDEWLPTDPIPPPPDVPVQTVGTKAKWPD